MILLKIELYLFYIAIFKVKRYLGHQDNRGWKAVSEVLKSLNWSQMEIHVSLDFMGFDHVTNQIYISIHIQK